MVKASLTTSFPRLYAAASLKRGLRMINRKGELLFSAALCRGLIEAMLISASVSNSESRFPRLYAAASLKRPTGKGRNASQAAVFRGFMPRPH